MNQMYFKGVKYFICITYAVLLAWLWGVSSFSYTGDQKRESFLVVHLSHKRLSDGEMFTTWPILTVRNSMKYQNNWSTLHCNIASWLYIMICVIHTYIKLVTQTSVKGVSGQKRKEATKTQEGESQRWTLYCSYSDWLIWNPWKWDNYWFLTSKRRARGWRL